MEEEERDGGSTRVERNRGRRLRVACAAVRGIKAVQGGHVARGCEHGLHFGLSWAVVTINKDIMGSKLGHD